MTRLTDMEVWLAVYSAAISGYLSGGKTNGVGSNAIGYADQAVKDFNKVFPPFDFASNEGKEKFNTDGSLPSTPTQK